MTVLFVIHRLEEVEDDLQHGSHVKATQVLRSMPTPMLSDVQAIYDETKMRSESLAQLVFQRVSPFHFIYLRAFGYL